MELSKEQQIIVEELLKIKKSVQTLTGFAGCGKSTVVSYLSKELPEFAVCAPTGRAAQVLRSKGVEEASTIHSLIYKPKMDSVGNIILDKSGSPTFILNPNLTCKGIIVDESSMLNKELYQDLLFFGIPIIFVGDSNQLEGIGDNANALTEPDFTLETIHRNAGEIAYFAEHIRKGYRPGAFASTGAVAFLNKGKAEEYFSNVDQIICAYNKTRVQVNQSIRTKKGLNDKFPVVGDRIMCLKNNKNRGLFNGMQGIITNIFKKPKNKITLLTDGGESLEVKYDPSTFYSEKPEFSHNKDDPDPFDYANCITCHKAQGGQWPVVMVLEQKCKNWDMRKWNYVCASRAEKGVIWVENYW